VVSVFRLLEASGELTAVTVARDGCDSPS